MAVTVTIRDVPDDVRAVLAQDAKAHGQSLQAFLLTVLAERASFSRNVEILAELERDLSFGGGADRDAPSAAAVLDEARKEAE